MKTLLLGATGYIGSAVADHLAAAGHRVVALRRPGAEPGPGVRIGDLADPASLTAAVTPDVDAVIHLASPGGDAVDADAVDALLAPLRRTGRAFVYASGVWVLGPTGPGPVGEDAPTDPIAIVGHRPGIERRVLAAGGDGVRASVVRPGIAHGRGGGIPALLVKLAREHGAPVRPGKETVRWPMVHVEDVAALFAAVAERAEPGTLWHGVAESAVPVGDLAAAAGRAAGVAGPVRPWPRAAMREALGAPFAEALELDQNVAGDAARALLGWTPVRPDAVAEVAGGSYGAV